MASCALVLGSMAFAHSRRFSVGKTSFRTSTPTVKDLLKEGIPYTCSFRQFRRSCATAQTRPRYLFHPLRAFSGTACQGMARREMFAACRGMFSSPYCPVKTKPLSSLFHSHHRFILITVSFSSPFHSHRRFILIRISYSFAFHTHSHLILIRISYSFAVHTHSNFILTHYILISSHMRLTISHIVSYEEAAQLVARLVVCGLCGCKGFKAAAWGRRARLITQ